MHNCAENQLITSTLSPQKGGACPTKGGAKRHIFPTKGGHFPTKGGAQTGKYPQKGERVSASPHMEDTGAVGISVKSLVTWQI